MIRNLRLVNMKFRFTNFAGYSLTELLVVLCLTIGLSLTAMVKSAELLKITALSSQAKLIQSLISNAIISAYRQNSELSLNIYKDKILLMRAGKIIDQQIVRKNIELSKVNQPISSVWIESIYPGGSQSPFTLQLKSGALSCLITVSLRGRVIRKCL